MQSRRARWWGALFPGYRRDHPLDAPAAPERRPMHSQLDRALLWLDRHASLLAMGLAAVLALLVLLYSVRKHHPPVPQWLFGMALVSVVLAVASRSRRLEVLRLRHLPTALSFAATTIGAGCFVNLATSMAIEPAVAAAREPVGSFFRNHDLRNTTVTAVARVVEQQADSAGTPEDAAALRRLAARLQDGALNALIDADVAAESVRGARPEFPDLHERALPRYQAGALAMSPHAWRSLLDRVGRDGLSDREFDRLCASLPARFGPALREAVKRDDRAMIALNWLSAGSFLRTEELLSRSTSLTARLLGARSADRSAMFGPQLEAFLDLSQRIALVGPPGEITADSLLAVWKSDLAWLASIGHSTPSPDGQSLVWLVAALSTSVGASTADAKGAIDLAVALIPADAYLRRLQIQVAPNDRASTELAIDALREFRNAVAREGGDPLGSPQCVYLHLEAMRAGVDIDALCEGAFDDAAIKVVQSSPPAIGYSVAQAVASVLSQSGEDARAERVLKLALGTLDAGCIEARLDTQCLEVGVASSLGAVMEAVQLQEEMIRFARSSGLAIPPEEWARLARLCLRSGDRRRADTAAQRAYEIVRDAGCRGAISNLFRDLSGDDVRVTGHDPFQHLRLGFLRSASAEGDDGLASELLGTFQQQLWLERATRLVAPRSDQPADPPPDSGTFTAAPSPPLADQLAEAILPLPPGSASQRLLRELCGADLPASTPSSEAGSIDMRVSPRRWPPPHWSSGRRTPTIEEVRELDRAGGDGVELASALQSLLQRCDRDRLLPTAHELAHAIEHPLALQMLGSELLAIVTRECDRRGDVPPAEALELVARIAAQTADVELEDAAAYWLAGQSAAALRSSYAGDLLRVRGPRRNDELSTFAHDVLLRNATAPRRPGRLPPNPTVLFAAAAEAYGRSEIELADYLIDLLCETTQGAALDEDRWLGRLARAYDRMGRGQFAAALSELRALHAEHSAMGSGRRLAEIDMAVAVAHAGLGNAGEAMRCVEQVLQESACPAPDLATAALLFRSELLNAHGDGDRAVASLELAAANLDAGGLGTLARYWRRRADSLR